jgi:hypothetical protein
VAGPMPAVPSTKLEARSRTMLSAQSMSSAFTSAARPAATAMVRMARWRMYSATWGLARLRPRVSQVSPTSTAASSWVLDVVRRNRCGGGEVTCPDDAGAGRDG